MSTKKEIPDRMDVRVPEEMRERLEAAAKRDNRSRNAQAGHYIEMGLSGLNSAQLAQAIYGLDAKLTEVIRRLDEIQSKK